MKPRFLPVKTVHREKNAIWCCG
ncbi:MAG: hypothetical protein RL693_1645, partial [Verrucomicrobiota bacterium]